MFQSLARILHAASHSKAGYNIYAAPNHQPAPTKETLMGSDEEKALIREAIARFPETFGLRAFPGQKFRISERASFFNTPQDLQLYVQCERGGEWLDFGRDCEAKLRAEIVRL